MIIASHQPYFFPWLGYFAKIKEAGLFVFSDDVQFRKGEFHNRNRLRANNIDGWRWLTAPVAKHHYRTPICDIMISSGLEGDWRRKHLGILRNCYHKSMYFHDIYAELETLYDQPYTHLADLNIATVKWAMSKLRIATATMKASQLHLPDIPVSGDKNFRRTRRLLNICQIVGASAYLAGSGASKDYLVRELFVAKGVQLRFQNYKHPIYIQSHSNGDKNQFLSHMSVLDLLFNLGPHAAFPFSHGIKESFKR